MKYIYISIQRRFFVSHWGKDKGFIAGPILLYGRFTLFSVTVVIQIPNN